MKTLNQFFISSQCEEVNYRASQNFITEKELDPIQLFKKELNLFLNSHPNFKKLKVKRQINMFMNPNTNLVCEISTLLDDGSKNMLFRINVLDSRELHVFTQPAL